MALAILDGTQTATTLSTILSSGQHITAHTVVSLGTQAITDMRSAVSGSVVSISNFPATQPISGSVTIGNSITIGSLPAISGTVTANLQNVAGTHQADIPSRAVRMGWGAEDTFKGVGVDAGGQPLPIQIYLGISGGDNVTTANPLPISGTVTAMAGTNFSNEISEGILNYTGNYEFFPILGTVTIGSALPAGTNRIGVVTIGGGTVTIGAGTAQIGSVTASISSFATSVTARLINPAGTAVTYAEVGTAGSPSIDVLSVQGVTSGTAIAISGTVTANSSNGSLTTRFGSVTTANTAFATSAVTNSNRKYLLIQNVTTASNVITVGIGFTPTTTQGIQLSSGAGLAFEGSYIPTGAVNLLSSVTASCFTILEA